MKFSIIIVTFNRSKELIECLKSIEVQKVELKYEIILIFNGDSSYQEAIVESFSSLPLNIISINKNTPAHARNVALTKARGEYVFFLDDDCCLPDNYFSNISFEQDWDVLGGPDQTPPNSSFLQRNIGLSLESPFCMGPTFRRHSCRGTTLENATEKELILCNLWFKTDLFNKTGLRFNEQLFRNEENYLLKILKNKNKKIIYNPKLFIYHKRKSNIFAFSMSVFKSGEYRLLNFISMPNSSELVYFLPLVIFPFMIVYTNYMLTLISSYLIMVGIYGTARSYKNAIGFMGLHLLILSSYFLGLTFGSIVVLKRTLRAR